MLLQKIKILYEFFHFQIESDFLGVETKHLVFWEDSDAG